MSGVLQTPPILGMYGTLSPSPALAAGRALLTIGDKAGSDGPAGALGVGEGHQRGQEEEAPHAGEWRLAAGLLRLLVGLWGRVDR